MELFHFNKIKNVKWSSVDDRVMGGKSQSSFYLEGNYGVFTGKVTTENFGGFCSIHGPSLKKDISEFNKFKIKIKGDGKKYRFLAYTTDRKGSYRCDIDVKNQWSTVAIPFKDLYPYKWGWKNYFATSFNPKNFLTLGFQVGYKEKGKFKLKVKKIDVV